MFNKSISQLLQELRDGSEEHTNLYYIRGDGGIEFWSKGRLHNESGPAIILPDNTRFFYINGVLHSEKEFLNFYLEKNLNKNLENQSRIKI